MESRTIEGTWEEVSRRGHELAGHRVRVIVLDEQESPEKAAGPTAYEVLQRAGLIGCLEASPGGPTDLATNPDHMEGFGRE